MFLDMIHGTIERRVLLNYRFDPKVLQKILPEPFYPKLYKGHGIGGVCMIRFSGLRPKPVPAWMGIRSENAAHRIAVEWEQDGQKKEGVFIPRRDTNSWFNKTFGGKVFPGLFQGSKFVVQETSDIVSIRIIRHDNQEQIGFSGHIADRMPASSIFPSLEEAANFFSLGATGYSATNAQGHFHGMDLRCLQWTVEPMAIEYARSNLYDDRQIFPAGSVELDSALIMRNIPHEWHSRPDLHLSENKRSLVGK
jgi:hypothetical protein